ncbi:MAG: DUF541 domain-containing protein, partial [Gammaproteobacteria bacterium]
MFRLYLPLLCLSLAFTAAAAEGPRSVTVGGSASLSAPPDMARISMAVIARHPALATAREQAGKVTADFLALCGRLGIPDAKIQTTGVRMQPEYRWDQQAGQQRLLGYLVQRELLVELDDLDLLGPLLEAAADAGVNQVSPPQLDSSARDSLHREALAAAARNARDNAAALAAALGARLGAVLSVQAQELGPMPPQPVMMRA